MLEFQQVENQGFKKTVHEPYFKMTLFFYFLEVNSVGVWKALSLVKKFHTYLDVYTFILCFMGYVELLEPPYILE